MGDRVARELARADLKFKVAEYYALVFMSTVVDGPDRLYYPAYLRLCDHWRDRWLFPSALLCETPTNCRLNKFNDQLSDMLNLMVNGLRAGYSTMQAMEAVSRELPAPISDEFHRVVQEMQIGIPNGKSAG